MSAIVPKSKSAKTRQQGKDFLKSKTARKHKPLPPKPYPDFPLTQHRSGKWCKRINGHMYYFGRAEGETYKNALLAQSIMGQSWRD